MKYLFLGLFISMSTATQARDMLIEVNNFETLSFQTNALIDSDYLSAGFVLEGSSEHFGLIFEGHSDFSKGFYVKGKVLKSFAGDMQRAYGLPLFEMGYRYTFFDTATVGVQIYNRYNYDFESIEGHPMFTIGAFI